MTYVNNHIALPQYDWDSTIVGITIWCVLLPHSSLSSYIGLEGEYGGASVTQIANEPEERNYLPPPSGVYLYCNPITGANYLYVLP